MLLDEFKQLFHYLAGLPQRSLSDIKRPAIKKAQVIAIIPTHRPDAYTIRLVSDLLRFNKESTFHVVLVDDCAPPESDPIFESLAGIDSNRLTLIKTPNNTLKAGAINYAIAYLKKQNLKPEIVVTLDDDVIIQKHTISRMATQLIKNPQLGAVCSLAQVENKNKNLLTRLQGLEYHHFNIIRTADDGYLNGPLVMHGMATAFRYSALTQVNGFAQQHLVEDYDITVRLKDLGWHVALSPEANAYTVVPENLKQLYRQRIRWNMGGVAIVTSKHKLTSVFQDLVGHFIFISNLILILLSLFIHRNSADPGISLALLIVSLVVFFFTYLFSLVILRYYHDKDWIDILIRLTILPELVYSILLTFILLGTYLFYLYTFTKRIVLRNRVDWVTPLDRLFRKLGYSQTWGGQ
jgi:poly-beta-1,6-N-acetyl-D-glucosamine synthase